MNLIAYLADSRGVVNTLHRLPTIAARFGISADKMERALAGYADLAAAYGTVPTLAVTANLVERYPAVFRRLDQRGVELAIHGYVHTDYSLLDLDEQRAHLRRGLAAFDKLGITVSGTRCPYVRWNDASVTAAKEAGLSYSSNRSVAWDVVPVSDAITPRARAAYRKGLALYRSEAAANMISLPAFIDGLLDLPASLPDDEALVDRLQARPDQREAIWRAILDQTYGLGEVFVLILHHERLALCRSALEAVLAHTRGRTPAVWLASLGQIAEWWQRRAAYSLALEPLDERRYRLSGPSDPDVTVLVRGVEVEGVQPWFDEWLSAPSNEFALACDVKPAIRIDDAAAPELEQFLREEGYVVEREGDDCALTLAGRHRFGESDKRSVVDEIEGSDAPLVRIWRWPNGARSVLSLTGDVDSMTLIDFLRRPLEV